MKSGRRPVALRAELNVLATLVNDLLEYKMRSRNPLDRHACSKWIRKLLAQYDRLEAQVK